MKKRLLAILLSLMMVLSLLPASVFAADATAADDPAETTTAPPAPETTYVAEVGGTGYKTLAEAVKAVQDNETITLLDNVTLSKDLAINNGKTFTIDLNGGTLGGADLFINGSAFVTATNGTISGDVWLKTTNVDKPFNSFTLAEDAKIVTEGWGIVVTQVDKGAENYGSVVNIQGSVTGKESALWVLGNITTDLKTAKNPVTVTVGPKAKLINNDEDKDGTSLQMAGACVVTVEDGAEISGGTAIEVRAGNLTVNGGTFTATAEKFVCNPNGDGTTTEGAALAIAQHTTKKDISVTINGGTFNGIKALNESNPQKNDPAPQVTLNVTDGTFNGDVSITDGDHTSVTGGAFTDIANAVKYAADNAIIKLAGDVTQDVTIPTDKTITLDLNGRTLTNVKDHTILNNGNLTITGTGTVDNITHGKAALYNNTGATATLNGGTFTRSAEKGTASPDSANSNSWYTVKNYGTMTINSNVTITNTGSHSSAVANGWFDASKAGSNGEPTRTADAVLTINGGNISGGKITVKNDDYGTLTITGGSISQPLNGLFCIYNANVTAISGGNVNGPVGNYNGTSTEADQGKFSITGGLFSTAPKKAYLAEGHFIDATTDSNYPYCVTDQKPESAPIAVTENTEAKLAEGDTVKETDKTAITEALNSSKTSVDGVANAVAPDSRVEIAQKSGVADADLNNNDKMITVDIKVDVTVTASDLEKSTLTFTATPVATVKVDGTATGTPVPVTNEMLNGKPITVKLPLPTVDGKLFTPKQIKHTSENYGVEYFINKAVTDVNKSGAKEFEVVDNCAVFTITHFSTFELSGDVTYVAPVYTSAPITKKDVKFDDVDVNAYYAPAVKWAVENKITAGKTDKLFAPDDTCTRGEMITFLWNAAGKPAAKNTTNPFTDVNVGAFYYDAVLWAVSNGITSGTSDTTFSPDNTVSRAQVVAFLYNYANKPAAANSTFSDVAADAYYAPAVGWAAAQKITSGTGNNTFSPENDCTRAQIVTFLYNDLAK